MTDKALSDADLTTVRSNFEFADADGNGELSGEESARFAASMLFARE